MGTCVDEMRHILARLRRDEQPLCTIAVGGAAVEVALAARQSIGGARIPGHWS